MIVIYYLINYMPKGGTLIEKYASFNCKKRAYQLRNSAYYIAKRPKEF